jgi:hypothetical protein
VQGFPALPHAAASPSLGLLPQEHARTYPQAPPLGGPPPIFPMPGPATLGPGSVQGGLGTGVAGVGLNPVAAVTPAAAPGGPHPLPSLPPCPLPRGFPNPFTLPVAIIVPQAASPPPFTPGTTTLIGPAGPLPGLALLP